MNQDKDELLPDNKTLKVLWAGLNAIRNYWPENHRINQMLIDPLNEIAELWENSRTPNQTVEKPNPRAKEN